MSDISLTSSMRANLSSLRMISGQMGKTQERLSTGLKVNSAIDNASSYYQAWSLTNRAADLEALLDNMGQGIQTINAAMEGLESGTAFLEQMSSIAAQAVAQYAGDNIQVIGSGMTASDIEALATDGTTLVLESDIVLDRGLNITAQNVSVKGRGLSIVVRGDNTAAITVDGGSAEISSLQIMAFGMNVIGLKATNGGSVVLDSKDNITVSGSGAQKIWYRDENLYNGRYNTQAIIDQIGAAGLAATAASQFYAPGVDKSDVNFGQGQWYLPSIGELMDLYGTDIQAMTGGYGTSGATSENKALVNAALAKLGGDAAQLSNGYYWSSSEDGNTSSWKLNMYHGDRNLYNSKDLLYSVRVFQHLENCFDTGEDRAAPKIGDVMYDDMTWGSADDYAAAKAAGKTAVGVINWISEDGCSAKIVNLKDLCFTSNAAEGNFNPDNPYTGSVNYTQWGGYGTNITGIDDYNGTQFFNAMKSSGKMTVTDIDGGGNGGGVNSAYQGQFNSALAEYDSLIADSSYQGINLLKDGKLNVTFNETRSYRFMVQGADMSAGGVGLDIAKWDTIIDVTKSLGEIVKALDFIRSFQSELGNNYQVIQTRQNFTDSLIDVLETGADNLTLADMNEESANYLALQTRQQLAVNSLSLAAQSAQSILSLF